MTKKGPSTPKLLHLLRFGSLMVISVCLLFCLFAYHRLHHSRLKRHPPFSASRISGSLSYDHFEGTPKIAFLFLAQRNLPLDFIWDAFFKNGDAEKFFICIHSEPGFVFNNTTTRSAFFYRRQLNNSVQVVWGESSMIAAEKFLLEAALLDPANQRFVLLSDSCIPLYNFSYTYGYVMASPKSFVDSFINVKENRYSPKMSSIIPREKWRKGSQWVTLVRRHAEIIVHDDIVFPIFEKFCKRSPPVDLIKQRQSRGIVDLLHYFEQNLLRIFKTLHNCIPDEHYVQTLLTLNGLEDELSGRTLTYTLWNHSATKWSRRPWHPLTFDYADASPQKIKEIKGINHIYHDSENRTERCHVSNNIYTPCYLFARKFTRGAAMRLLNGGLLGGFI